MYYPEKKIIFVHVPKTAGQSIEQFFMADADSGWDHREKFLMGPNEDPAKGPRRLAHLLARDYVGCGHVSQGDFDTCFKFGFVRHPLTRALSFYKYNRAFKRMSFVDYLTDFIPKKLAGPRNGFHRPQVDFLCDAMGRPMVDFVGRFENLEADFAHVCKTVGLPFEHLEHANQSLKSDHVLKNMRLGWAGRVKRAAKAAEKRIKHPVPKPDFPVPTYGEAEADPQVTAAVQSIYGADYDVFGYPRV